MKSTIDLADLLGLYFVMSKIAGKGEIKFLVAGLGWATAELLMTRFLPLWFGARGVEFDWKYIQMSFDSNISLVSNCLNFFKFLFNFCCYSCAFEFCLLT